ATNNNTSTKHVYIDLSPIVDSNVEAGLLGMAFHPDYQNNRQVFLSFTEHGNGSDVSVVSYIARYTESADGMTLDASSRENILSLNQPFNNHNGGNIVFGPDGNLYIGFGDGGAGDDPFDNGQNPNNWF